MVVVKEELLGQNSTVDEERKDNRLGDTRLLIRVSVGVGSPGGVR